MIEFYGEIRVAHVAAVIASGGLFLVRGLLVLAGRPALALAAAPRYFSFAVDTTLLTAAMMLVAILPSAVFSNGWLAAKIVVLPVYVGLGWLALRAQKARLRNLALAGAVASYATMYAIARTHDPLGPVRAWLAS